MTDIADKIAEYRARRSGPTTNELLDLIDSLNKRVGDVESAEHPAKRGRPPKRVET